MEIQERIDGLWTSRVQQFIEARENDLHGEVNEIWKAIIRENLPEKDKITALDLGTGVGYYAFLLREMGCEVHAIDYSHDMIKAAVQLAEKYGFEGIDFRQMDAQELDFPDESIDFIISRNVTWTLPDTEKAYREMCRVLTKGGRILNFDANYGAAFIASDADGVTDKMLAEADLPPEKKEWLINDTRVRNGIAADLYISRQDRPSWDISVLLHNGITKVWLDMDIEKRVPFGHTVKKEKEQKYDSKYIPRIFMLRAEK